jgi:hypothetical protein
VFSNLFFSEPTAVLLPSSWATEDWTLKVYVSALVMDAETLSQGMEFHSMVMQLVEEEVDCCIWSLCELKIV